MSVDLVVANIAEFNLRNAEPVLGPATRATAVELAAHVGDCAALWSTGERVLVLPAGTDPAWFADLHQALRLAPPPVVSPVHRSGMPLEDLLHDGGALGHLRDLLAGRGPVRLLSWGATPQLYLLAAALRGWGLTVELDGVPEDRYWASLYLDAKLSCLDLARGVPGVRVPRGLTVSSLPELRGALDLLLRRHRHVIVRGRYGVGGEGSAVVRFGGGRALSAFWVALQRDEFFHGYPLLVQEYVRHAPGVGCPAVDVCVGDDGVGEAVVTAMTVDGHRFRSVLIGPGSLPPAEAGRSRRVAVEVAQAARALGYRGWMCVDFVLGADGELYVTEINARRSGAMHGIALLRHLATTTGRDGLTAASHDTAAVGPGLSYADDVRPAFRRLWERGVAVYPTATRGLRSAAPTLGVLAAASTAAGAEAAVAEALAGIRTGASLTRTAS